MEWECKEQGRRHGTGLLTGRLALYKRGCALSTGSTTALLLPLPPIPSQPHLLGKPRKWMVSRHGSSLLGAATKSYITPAGTFLQQGMVQCSTRFSLVGWLCSCMDGDVSRQPHHHHHHQHQHASSNNVNTAQSKQQ